MSDDPYSRVYWRVRSDERFVGIYANNNHLATWLRLLISADAAWPAPADLPRSARRASIAALAECGLIELLPGDLYRVHGLDNERNARSTKARESVMHRYNDRSTTVVRPKYDTPTSRAKPSQDEPSIAGAREGLPNLNATVSAIWEEATGRTVIASGQFAIEYLDDACRRYPAYEVGAAIKRGRMTFDHVPATQPLIVAVRAILDPLPDAKGAASKAAEAEESRRRKRAVESTLAGNHAVGGHAAKADPRCPSCQVGTGPVQ